MQEVAESRMARSGLVEAFDTPEEVAGRLVGVQAQFIPPAGLAIRSRLSSAFSAADLDQRLHSDKTLIRLWGQRRTVHVYAMQDWPTIVSASKSVPNYRERLVDRLGRTETELEAAMARVESILESVARASRAELMEADPSLEPWFEYGNLLLMDLVKSGSVCHAGQDRGRSYFAHRAVWMPGLSWGPPSPHAALRDLARRYFQAYGPATVQDLGFWLGARSSDAKAAAAALSDELIEISVEGTRMLDHASTAALYTRASAGGGDSALRLLYRFDPLLLGHKDKAWLVDEAHYKAVWRKAGYVEAVILKRGRIAGTWGYERKGRSVRVWAEPFAKLSNRDSRVLQREAEGVASYFEAPLQRVEIK